MIKLVSRVGDAEGGEEAIWDLADCTTHARSSSAGGVAQQQ